MLVVNAEVVEDEVVDAVALASLLDLADHDLERGVPLRSPGARGAAEAAPVRAAPGGDHGEEPPLDPHPVDHAALPVGLERDAVPVGGGDPVGVPEAALCLRVDRSRGRRVASHDVGQRSDRPSGIEGVEEVEQGALSLADHHRVGRGLGEDDVGHARAALPPEEHVEIGVALPDGVHEGADRRVALAEEHGDAEDPGVRGDPLHQVVDLEPLEVEAVVEAPVVAVPEPDPVDHVGRVALRPAGPGEEGEAQGRHGVVAGAPRHVRIERDHEGHVRHAVSSGARRVGGEAGAGAWARDAVSAASGSGSAARGGSAEDTTAPRRSAVLAVAREVDLHASAGGEGRSPGPPSEPGPWAGCASPRRTGRGARGRPAGGSTGSR